MTLQRGVRGSGLRIALRVMAAAGAIVAACGALAGEVTLKTAWMRPAAAGMAEAQVYVDIISEAKLELVGASTPFAKRVELVEVNLAKEPPESKVVTSILVPAGKTTRLAFKGSHLRLVGITKNLGNGTAVPMTLAFKSTDGKEVTATIDAQVRGLLLPQQMPAVVTKEMEPAAVIPSPPQNRPQ